MDVKITRHLWGQYNGRDIFLYRLSNRQGTYVEVTNFGATITAIVVPDKQNRFENVVVGFPVIDGYIDDTCYIGSTIGRYANRISEAKFILDGHTYQLNTNDGKNTNHGGYSGFNRQVFDTEVNGSELKMTYLSRDGEGGFPGNLDFTVTCSWNDDNELLINYESSTDKATIANFTNHAYFNLSAFRGKIGGHQLSIPSQHILHLWEDNTPSGAVVPAGKMRFNDDLVESKFNTEGEHTSGINLYYIFDDNAKKRGLHIAATLTEPTSGRMMEVYTDYPGLFLYTGDYLESRHLTDAPKQCEPFDGICLECQHYPDSINHPNFPQAVLRPGEKYNQNILFKFGITDNVKK